MSNSTAIQAASNTEAIVGNFTKKELDTLKATIAKGTTNEQFGLFVQTCVNSGLNPFLNQIYCITYNGKDGPTMSIQVAVEGIVALAKRNPQYKGFIASEVKENDEFEIDMVTGEPVHKITSMQRGKTVGAYCVAYREGAPNVSVVITNDQVEHLVKGRNGGMWRDYFDDMIVKHATKRAFKRQFGIEIAEDEVATSSGTSIDNVPEYQPQPRKDITPQQEQLQESTTQQTQQESVVTEEQVRAEIGSKFEQLGITDKKEMSEYIQKHAKPKGDKPTLQELIGLSNIMDMHIEMKQEQQNDELPM